ncbi:hypothetical protein BaRGS_00006909, partial [Batillaria attramentaria]
TCLEGAVACTELEAQFYTSLGLNFHRDDDVPSVMHCVKQRSQVTERGIPDSDLAHGSICGDESDASITGFPHSALRDIAGESLFGAGSEDSDSSEDEDKN